MENNQHALNTGLASKTTRRVSQYTPDKKTLIKIHDTLRGAGLAIGVHSSGIAKVCKGSRQKAGGFWWKFTDANPNEVKLSKSDLKKYKTTNDFPDYLINKEGKVYSKRYKKFMKQLKNNDGYFTIQLTKNGNRKSYLIHRLVADHFVKNDDPVNNIKVNFKDNDTTNVNADNLVWVANSENGNLARKVKKVNKIKNKLQEAADDLKEMKQYTKTKKNKIKNNSI